MAEILLVEDNRDIADLLAVVLRREGHLVRIARDGQEGLRLLRERTPELALLDVEMPVLTGPEMASRMFLHDAGEEEVPIVLLSGVADLPLVAAAVGTPYFLGKPYQLKEVLALVALALRERRRPVPTLTVDSENAGHRPS